MSVFRILYLLIDHKKTITLQLIYVRFLSIGKKTSGKVPPKTEYFKPQQNAVNHEFIPNREFIDQINSAQSSWKAVVYEEYSGMTTAQLISRGGGLKRQNFPKPR